MTEEIDHNVDEQADESGVIKALRGRVKELEAEAKTRPVREDLEVEIRTQLKREQDAAALLIEQGHSGKLAGFMLSEIGDAEITGETVVEFLQGLGYDTQAVSSDGSEQASQAQQLAEVTSLASRVSAASSGGTADDVLQRIQNAESSEALASIMEEIGAVQS